MMIPRLSFAGTAQWGPKITVESDHHSDAEIEKSLDTVSYLFSRQNAADCPAIKADTKVNIGGDDKAQFYAVSEIQNGERVGIGAGQTTKAASLDSMLRNVARFFRGLCS
jgi:hypothetical protein